MATTAFLRVRMNARDARTETGQIDPTRLLELFQDVGAELCIRETGDEGSLRALNEFQVASPVRVGDYVEVRGRLVEQDEKTATVELSAYKVIRSARTVAAPFAGEVLDPPRLVARAVGVWRLSQRVIETRTAERAPEGEAEGSDPEGRPAREPLSWGGHRPREQGKDKRRPGPEVRMRPEEEEREPRPFRPRRDEGGPPRGEGGPRPYRPRRDEGGPPREGGPRPYRPRRDEGGPPRGEGGPRSSRPRPGGGGRPGGGRPPSKGPRR